MRGAGDNIISSHGATWKTYQAVIKPGLQQKFDAGLIAKNAAQLCSLIRQATQKVGGAGITVQDLLQRYSVANCSEVLLSMKLQVSTDQASPFTGSMVFGGSEVRGVFRRLWCNHASARIVALGDLSARWAD